MKISSCHFHTIFCTCGSKLSLCWDLILMAVTNEKELKKDTFIQTEEIHCRLLFFCSYLSSIQRLLFAAKLEHFCHLQCVCSFKGIGSCYILKYVPFELKTHWTFLFGKILKCPVRIFIHATFHFSHKSQNNGNIFKKQFS